MLSFRVPLRATKIAFIVVLGVAFLPSEKSAIANASTSSAQLQQAPTAEQQAQAPPAEEPVSTPPKFDKAIFQNPIPSEQMAFLRGFAGAKTKDLFRDKQFQTLVRTVEPNVEFHYGRDMRLSIAMEIVMKGSSWPVQIRDDRYVLIYGLRGPYLQGRGFMWFDMKDGIGLGAFFFAPTNGEPTPTVTVFSKQVLEASLEMSQLPPEFAEDLDRWAAETKIPELTTRYFLSGMKEKILLEHDVDHCAGTNGTAPAMESACEQMNADAADIDMNAAYYLQATHHATNGTAWMISGPSQVAWIQYRENTCRVGPDPLGCRIRLTRARTRLFLRQQPPPRLPHS